MSERSCYYARRLQAVKEPKLYLSTIGDGMAQIHNLLPHLGAAGGALSTQFETRLQGLLVHGKVFYIFRYFANVKKGFNPAAHAWLCALDVELRTKGKLPPTLYHQIDGGVENACPFTIAIGEFIVHRRLAKKVIFSRLMVSINYKLML